MKSVELGWVFRAKAERGQSVNEGLRIGAEEELTDSPVTRVGRQQLFSPQELWGSWELAPLHPSSFFSPGVTISLSALIP